MNEKKIKKEMNMLTCVSKQLDFIVLGKGRRSTGRNEFGDEKDEDGRKEWMFCEKNKREGMKRKYRNIRENYVNNGNVGTAVSMY